MPAACDNSLAAYRVVISRYTSNVQIAGIDVSSDAIPLAKIFVDPQLRHSAPPWDIQRGPHDLEPGATVGGRESRSATEPALQVLQQNQQLAILGEPGQGKTTLLRQYASALSRDPLRRVPILVEFRQHREKLGASASYLDWLLARLPDPVREHLRQESECRNALVKIIEEGNGAVLLDGLDELTFDAQQEVQQLVPELAHRRNQVVLSSRPNAYRLTPFAGFAPYHLQELAPEQIKSLATSLCRALAPQFELSDFNPALQCVLQASQGPAAALARNPLLLSFLCFTVFERQNRNQLSDFPHSAAPLIRECLHAVVAWHKRRGHETWPQDLQAEDVVRILKPLALAAYMNGTRIIKQEYLSPQSTKERKISDSEKEVFFNYLLPARLVEQRGGDYAFPLETFGEYFAARAVAASDDPYACVREYLHDPAWERVIVLTAGCLERDRANILIRELPTLTRWIRKGFGFVTSMVSAFMPKGVKEATDQSGKLLEGPLERWDARSRRSTEFFITWISRHGFQLWPLWERGFHYEQILRRDLRTATRCLGMCKDPATPLVRKLIQATLTRWANDWEEPPFLLSVQEAASAPNVRAYLIKLASDRKDAGLANGALRGLETSADEPEVLTCLLNIINTGDKFRQYDAAQVLAKAPFNRNFRDKLLELTRHSRWTTREAAVLALKDGVSDALIRERFLAMLTDKSKVVRRTAAYALEGAVSEPEVKKLMLRFAHHRDGYFRHVAVGGLSQLISDSKVLKCILRLARDPRDPWVQPEAVRALSALAENPYIRARLQKIASSGNSLAQPEAQRALGNPSGKATPQENSQKDSDEVLCGVANGYGELPDDSDETINRALTLTNGIYLSKYIVRALRRFADRPNVASRLVLLR